MTKSKPNHPTATPSDFWAALRLCPAKLIPGAIARLDRDSVWNLWLHFIAHVEPSDLYDCVDKEIVEELRGALDRHGLGSES